MKPYAINNLVTTSRFAVWTRTMNPSLRKYVIFAVISLAITLFTILRTPPMVWKFDITEFPMTAETQPYFETVFDYELESGTAHAPAIIIEPDGISLIWFQGTREGAADVTIVQSTLSQNSGQWSASAPQPLLTTPLLETVSQPAQRIVILGNTIQNGERLLATIVSVGGWASAAIADVRMDGGTPVHVRKLSLSPFLNRSYLVKTPPLIFADGDIALPAYFELGNAFGELVRLDSSSRVRDKRRITQGRQAIQPAIVAMDPDNAVALSRNFDDSGHLMASWTSDGGKSWSNAEPLAVPNPNAPVAALRLANGGILMAFNDSNSRADLLRLAVSTDGGHSWRRIATLEDHDSAKGQQARYPMMRRLPDGQIVLVYSHSSKGGIRAHIFNETWVMAQ